MNLAQVTLEETGSHSYSWASERGTGNCKGTPVAGLQQWDWFNLGDSAQTRSTTCSWRRTGLREGREKIMVLALEGVAL